jgi:hypothetical protein
MEWLRQLFFRRRYDDLSVSIHEHLGRQNRRPDGRRDDARGSGNSRPPRIRQRDIDGRAQSHQNHAFSKVAAFETTGFNLTGIGHPERINAAQISSTALPLLGVAPELGRNFTSAEDRYEATSLQTLISESLAKRRFTIVLLGSFSGIGLLLASIGIFGVISYLVAQRTREFGVRMALGANRSQIAQLVLSRGARIALTGSLCGLALSAFASRLLLTSLYQTNWYDPATLCPVPVLFFAVVLFATWLPARQAAKVDPMQALRAE